MELFLPSVIVILLAAFFGFLVLPRLGTMLLAVLSVVALCLVAYHHYSMFGSEYRLSTWQVGLTAYAPWIILALLFFFIIALVQSYSSSSDQTPFVRLTNSLQSSYNKSPIIPGLGVSASGV